jgi:hypothetical protein
MIYSCPHCRTQNFATKARLCLVKKKPLKCWKCGKEIEKFSRKKRPKKNFPGPKIDDLVKSPQTDGKVKSSPPQADKARKS